MSIFFIGSYTQILTPDIIGVGDGIYTVQLNDNSGELRVLNTTNVINPSYLTISDDNKYLYCNTEVNAAGNPKVQAYKIKDGFSLEFLNEQSIAGGYPCHIEKIDNHILVACYETGNVLQFPLDSHGKLMECAKNHQHTGSSIHTTRQEAPHAHQVAVHPNKRNVYVCDLGIDTLKAYKVQENKLTPSPQKDIGVSKGGGPRHLVFNKDGNLGYVINELTSSVSVLKNKGNKFEQIGSYNSLPESYQGSPSASAIRIHPNGKFLYVANRIFDAITIFKIDGDTLDLVDYKKTKASEIREFNISPSGKWLIACHQYSNDTTVNSIKDDGKITEVYRTKEIKTPVCVAFLN